MRKYLLLAVFVVGCKSKLDCPDGTHSEQVTNASGNTELCLTADGVKEGPFRSRTSDGRLFATGSFLNDRPHGINTVYNVDSGTIFTQAMIDDDGVEFIVKDGVPVKK